MPLFRARARTLDMLGRQQIAGVPTAISELFKNAHDAYATRAEADFYRPTNTFVLRDDGLGMTEPEFIDRWLTLGTDSKLGSKFGLPPPPVDPKQDTRPIMGEKGVGRLAIATLGSQVLVLTRAKRGKELGDVVAAFVNWEIFECPGLDLSDIDIPVRAFKSLPSKEQIQILVEQTATTIKHLTNKIDPILALRLLKRLYSFDVDPKRYFSRDFSLAGEGHGTTFIIQPADENLRLDLDDTEGVAPLTKMLIGFSNTLAPQNNEQGLMRTEFRDHRSSDNSVSLIGESEFFTDDDFQKSDHRIIGSVDATGTFKGTVSVYDEPTKRYELEWKGTKSKETACGSFSLRFAYLQGVPTESRLDPEQYALLAKKLDTIGGLYLYRDGIRILPYGNNEFDFLDIELRRSKNAGRYFFSYRRMFGSIEVTRKHNPDLQEKAGREGFRSNKAYREFKAILENLLIQLAAEFFRRGGERAEPWETRKAEYEQRESTRRGREQESKRIRGQVQQALGTLLEKFAGQEPQKRLKLFAETAHRQFKAAAERAAREGIAQAVVDAESTLRGQLDAIRASYVYERPKGFALDARLQDTWDDYQEQYAAIERIFRTARSQLDEASEQATDTAKVSIDQRQRAERALNDKIQVARKRLTGIGTEIESLGRRLADKSLQRARAALGALEEVIANALLNFTKSGKLPAAKFAELRDAAVDRIDACAEVQLSILTEIRDQLHAIDSDAEPGSSDRFALTEALEEELIATRERAEEAFNIAQLGMAVEVINHEFSASIKGVRRSVRRLRSWADANVKLKVVYDDLQKSFEHLDGYLSLFTPLSRRVARQPIEIHGSDISEYLSDLFGERMKRHEVDLRSTKEFDALILTALPSTFYPVFVNLVDNALYWLSTLRRGSRMIDLDCRKGVITVSDSGPGISARDRERIFERGFTRKTAGQGLGLYVARSVLARNGYTLSLAEAQANKGATFMIQPVQK
jgi:signal transduction histidine kinase